MGGWIAGGVALLFVLVLVSMYNRLVRLRQHVRESWADVDTELSRRHDLIPNLVETVRGYAAHERAVMETIAAVRASALAARAAPAEPFLLPADEPRESNTLQWDLPEEEEAPAGEAAADGAAPDTEAPPEGEAEEGEGEEAAEAPDESNALERDLPEGEAPPGETAQPEAEAPDETGAAPDTEVPPEGEVEEGEGAAETAEAPDDRRAAAPAWDLGADAKVAREREALRRMSLRNRAARENDLMRAMAQLLSLTEAYPALKADSAFLRLQEELVITEDRIQAARRFYNANVRENNVRIQTFPSSLLARLGGFREAEFFELADQRLREPVQVSFN